MPSAISCDNSRHSDINNCQNFQGEKKMTQLCSRVTSLTYNKSILNFKTEVQNSACTGGRLSYGHTMQTLPHTLRSFHHPHGTVETKTQSQR